MAKFLLIFCIFLSFTFSFGSQATKDFSRNLGSLIDFLFSEYQQHARPAKKVDVEMVASMGRLIKVDEKNGIFEAMIINGIVK